MGAGSPETQSGSGTDTASGARHDDHRPIEAQVRESTTACDRRPVH